MEKTDVIKLGKAAAAVFAALNNTKYETVLSDGDTAFCIVEAMRELAEAIGEDAPAIEMLQQNGSMETQQALAEMAEDGVLVRAALAVRETGHYAYYIEKVMAAALVLSAKKGVALRDTLKELTGLREPDVLYCILEHAKKMENGFAAEDAAKAAYIKEAYALGFASEKKYRGCGQCAIIALDELMGESHDDIFKCATGFSGGMALCGDGVCGGYAGGMMIMSLIRGRALEPMKENGDKINQYAAYETSQMIHDKFVECYGSPICREIHEQMFGGEHYILRTKQRRNEFEEAGAHTVVCTTVVALSCAWTAEIMLKKRLVRLNGQVEEK